MNSETLRRNYDKLTPRERFAAVERARARDDKSEVEALLRSGPRKILRPSSCAGLDQGFQWLAMAHLASQLKCGLFLLSLVFPRRRHGLPAEDHIHLVQRWVLQGREAWRTVCHEYDLDPEAMLRKWPWTELVTDVESMAEDFNRIDPVELTGLQETCEEYRDAITGFSHLF